LSATLNAKPDIVTFLTVRGSCWFRRVCNSGAVKTTLPLPKLLQSIPAIESSATSAVAIHARLRLDMVLLCRESRLADPVCDAGNHKIDKPHRRKEG
jgi:hypothetical protein